LDEAHPNVIFPLPERFASIIIVVFLRLSTLLRQKTLLATMSSTATSSTDRAALLSTETAAQAAHYGTSFVNNAYTRITEAQREGPLTFRMLGFIGGIAMTVSNALSILNRFFSFNFAGALLAVYGVFFGR
jgi:guanyl-specific ribonuclease Sa